MLEDLYTHPIAAPRLRSSPFGPWLDSFDEWLAQRGHNVAARRARAPLAADFGRWTARRQLSASTIDESVVEVYVDDRGTDRERRHATAVLLLEHLRAEGVAPPALHATTRQILEQYAKKRDRILPDVEEPAFFISERGRLPRSSVRDRRVPSGAHGAVHSGRGALSPASGRTRRWNLRTTPRSIREG